MHVSDLGSGRAVLLLHACPIPGEHFAPLVQALASQRRVLIPDLPGYGKSEPLVGEHTLERVTDLLADELTQRAVDEVDIVGHSLGAYRAFALALSGRVRVGTIVSLGGFAGLEPATAQGYRELAAGFRSGAASGESLMGIAFAPGYVEAHPAEAEECRRLLRAVPAAVAADELDALANAKDLRPRVGGLEMPIVLRVGALDQAVLPAWSDEIAERVPGAIMQVVPGCGHMLLFEDRDATIAAVCSGLGVQRRGTT